ncbi:hypothetical protein LXA43DRAFT_198509 [Ganoderma leucocontextum]|nr:hypothetical protein LXA43DRAFT_198509 [Ganoderma leucocontextum]
MKRPLDAESTLQAPPSTLATSEYWVQSTPRALRQKIARRIAEPGAKEGIVKAISNQPLEFKTLWNRSLPINQLPYELLVQIFILVHSEYQADSGYLVSWTGWPTPNFLKLMGTCRRWRDTIIETPAFWSVISLEYWNTNWTGLRLARSLGAPIEVWARVPEWCHPDRLEAAYPLVHRIRSLHFAVDTRLNVDNPECDWPFRLLFGREIPAMPALEKLEFAVQHGMGPRTPSRFPVDVELTLTHFPCLRSLTLAGMVSPQDTALYVDLHTLSLTTCSHSLSIDHFLDTLALCTRLETLSLKDTLDRFSDDWKQRGPTPRRPLISFPRLDTFVISGHGAVCTSRFLEHFHIRSSARIDISANVDARSSDGAFALARWLPPRHALTLEPLATVNDIRMCMLSRAGPKSVWISTDRTPEMAVTACVSMDVALTIMDGVFRDPAYTPSDYGQGSVQELVEFLGRSPVTSLSIVDVHPDAVATWAGVFRTFPLLERLSVLSTWGRDRALGLENVFLGLHAASTTTTGPGLPAALGLACPNLKHISVDGFGSTPVYEAIRTCIGYRRGRGVVLERLDLNRLGLDLSLAGVCRACAIKDIVGCTRRLELSVINADGLEERAVLGAADIDPVCQGDAQVAAPSNSGCVAATCTHRALAGASEGPRGGSIRKESFKSALRRLGGVFGRHVKLDRMAKQT